MKGKKFKILNGQLCISIDAIVEATSEKIRNTIYNGIKRYKNELSSSYEYYYDPADKRKRFLVIDRLPSSTQDAILLHYNNPLYYYTAEHFTDALHNYIYTDDIAYFYNKTRQQKIKISSSRIDQLAEACGWLRMLSDQYLFGDFNENKKAYLYHAAQIISKRNIYGLRISHWRSLDHKINAWKREQRECVLPKRYNNQNSKRLPQPGYDFIIKTYSNPLKLSVRETWNQYLIQAKEQGWKTLGMERVRQIIQLPSSRQLWMESRNGSSVSRNALERTIKRRKPSFPDAMWSIDGLTVQLRYLEKGKVRSDLYSVLVLDVYSDKIVGYSIGTTETATMVQAALRSAGRNTMNLPVQVQYDNGSANLSKEVQDLLPRLAKFNFPTAPYNGKSKPIENFIGRLERLNLRYFPNFKGGNITSHSLAIKANPDFLEVQRKNKTLPSKDGAIAQFELAIATHNKTKGKDGLTPDERYKKEDKRRRKMDYLAMVDTYWVERKYKARYTKDGLTIEVDKQRHTYEVEERKGIEDMQFRMQWLGHRFTIKYDPDDLGQIHLYDNDVWIAMAVTKYEAPMAMVDREEGEGEIISDALYQRKLYEQTQRDILEAMGDRLEEAGISTDLDHNILKKDAYNRMEGRVLDDLLARTAIPDSKPKTTKKQAMIDLYSDDEADGSIIEDY